ncbi:MAG: Unknown protein [uncultured Sulfurovum sp.]|uniref:Uncharacterized protein n=1 Tax=uncultured Sulfurovum sp. TaxID=269237 RepID=A0A6S6SV51_9BACT|nr:MAG: Unknown protein [uncultured Sulfurovum sp.]
MGIKFEKLFSEPIRFLYGGVYLGGFIEKEDALVLFKKEELANNGETSLELKDIKEAYIRFQPTPLDLREDGVDDMAWITCNKNDFNAQQCWKIL